MERMKEKDCCQTGNTNTVECRNQECPGRVGDACTEKHQTSPPSPEHIQPPVCREHDARITHICVKYGISVCQTCIEVNHAIHTEDIMEYNQGILIFKEQLRELKKRTEDNFRSLDDHESEVRRCMEVNDQIREIIKERHEEAAEDTARCWKQYEELAQETARMKNLLDSTEEAYEQNTDSLEHIKKVRELYEQILKDVRDTENKTDEFVAENFNSTMQRLQSQFDKISKEGEVEYKLSSLAQTDLECGEVWKRLMKRGKEKWVSEPKCLLHLTNESNPDLELNWPMQVICANNSIFVANSNPGQVLRLDKRGNIIRKYILKNPVSGVRGLALYEDLLYVNSLIEITKMTLDGKEQIVYKCDTQPIWKMVVVNSEKFILTDGKSPTSRIYDYNPKTNTVRVCVSGLTNPSYISAIFTEGQLRYIVSVGDGRVKLYNEEWQEQATMGSHGNKDGELCLPQATVVTDSNTILVADWGNYRISEFTLEGTFLRHVLTKHHGIRLPYGLAYSRPYLWITEGSSPSYAAIKCFQIAE